MKEEPLKVFLDANVLIQTGKPPGGPIFKRLVDLVECGFVKILTTDLTKDEIIKKHTENDYNVVKEIGRPHFRKIAKQITEFDLPSMTKADIHDKLFERSSKDIEMMFIRLKAECLSIDMIKPSTIFAKYTHKQGLFSGEGKKNQFPDAFIFECLKESSSTQSPIIIVSNDGDFDKPVQTEKDLSVVKSIVDLFKNMGLQIEEPDVEYFLEENHNYILELFDSELSDWGLQVSDIEDAEIEDQSITELELFDIISFGTTGNVNDILVVGS